MENDILKFSKLLPSQFLNESKWEGFLAVHDKDYWFCFTAPKYPLAKDIALEKADLSIYKRIQCLNNDALVLLEDIEKHGEVSLYLSKLQSLLETIEFANPSVDNVRTPEINEDLCHHLVKDIENLGWDKVTCISPDFNSIKFSSRDLQGRDHNMSLEISSNYPSSPPTISVDLPHEPQFLWGKNSNLRTIYDAWESQIASLELFWNILDALDEVVLVLDPVNPSRKDQSRRIILENQVSIHFTVEPDCPSALPKYQLLGPSKIVSELNEKILLTDPEYQSWNSSEDLVTNFERLFGLEIVRKGTGEEGIVEEWDLECAICYCLHLEELLPDYSCSHCSKKFHISCLVNWLKDLPNSRHKVQSIKGECPVCEKPILCKMK